MSLRSAIVVLILGAFCIPHVGEAMHNLQPLTGGFMKNWDGFVCVVLALSGVEAIANATGMMKLDPGITDERPSVSKTSTKALFIVMIEVCGFAAPLGPLECRRGRIARWKRHLRSKTTALQSWRLADVCI